MLFMAIGLPKMMENMDPEMLEEMQQQQSAMGGGDPMEMWKKMMSGETPGAEQAQGQQATQPTVEPPRRGKTDKRKGRRAAA